MTVSSHTYHPRAAQRRRRFRILAIAWLAIISMHGAATAQTKISIGFLGEPASDGYAGAKLGLDEANSMGEFLGLQFSLVNEIDNETKGLATLSAILTTRVGDDLRQLSARVNIPVFDVRSTDDSLRAECLGNVFFMRPSDSMLMDAAHQWQSKHPDRPGRIAAWQSKSGKYAATQLNDRYRDAFGRAMSDEAWSGWAAVKLIAETVARDPTVRDAALIKTLRDNTSLDGSRGAELSFRETGQLRQPLWILDNTTGAPLGEAPVRGVANPADLDSIAHVGCAK